MSEPPYTLAQLHSAIADVSVASDQISKIDNRLTQLTDEGNTADAELVTAKALSTAAVAEYTKIREWINANGPVHLRGAL